MGSKKVPLPKICHTNSTIIKLGTVIPYLKRIQKIYNHVTYLLSSANTNIFHFKGALLGLRRFLATEIPLEMMKNAFYFTL